MNILVLAEGDPENAYSMSGIPYSVVRHMRAAGCQVMTGDVELHGLKRLGGALATLARTRSRWSAKFHTASIPFAVRSRNARQLLVGRGRSVGAVLQYGSTFWLGPNAPVPYFLYMDSCMHMAAASSQSWAGSLTPEEIARVIAREQAVYEGAAAIFTFSEAARQGFVRLLGLPAERIVTTYPGPNLDLSLIPDRSRIARDTRAPTVLFVGREFERKGGDILLRAFRDVRARMPQARLLIVGPRELSIGEPGVTNLGLLRKDNPSESEALIHAYRSADVFCFPTRYEPFGIVVLEAMLFGLPCVATNTGAISEMIIDGQTGFLVPTDDPEAVTARLLTLLGDPELAGRLGESGRQRAEQHFTWEATVDKMLNAMAQSLDGTRRNTSGHA